MKGSSVLKNAEGSSNWVMPGSSTRKLYRSKQFGRNIHGGAGTFENSDTRFINAAYLNEWYQPAEPAGIVRILDL